MKIYVAGDSNLKGSWDEDRMKVSWEDTMERMKLAEHGKLRPHTLQALADDPYYRVRQNLASNPNTPLEILEQLSEDTDSCVRHAVVYNPKTPTSLLVKMFHSTADAAGFVQQALANRKDASADILAELSDSKFEWVLKAVALNRNTPEDVLTKLSKHWNYEIRQAVASNPETPVEVLQKLSKDRNSARVRRTAIAVLGRIGT